MSAGRRAVGVLIVVGALAGCSSASTDPQYVPTAAPSGETPVFVGAWAEEITDLYLNSKSDLEREVLADEVISDEEYLALEDWYIGCMAGQGITVTVEEFGYDLGDGDQDSILAAEGVCKTDTLSTALWMQGNPDNIPPLEATHACLVRHGDLDPSLTFDEFERTMNSYPYDAAWESLVFSEEYRACNWDPVDLLGLYPSE